MTSTHPGAIQRLLRLFLVAFLGLALVVTSAPAGAQDDDDDDSGSNWGIWAILFGAAAAGIITAATADNNGIDLGGGTTVVKPQGFTKSPQKVKTAMATLNRQASGIANDDIRQIAVTATMDTHGSPLFGLTGADVPVTTILLMRPNQGVYGWPQGWDFGGKTLADDFVGYPADQIVAFHLRVGEVEGTGKEVSWVNPASYPAAAVANPPLTFSDQSIPPNGAAAKVFFNGNLLTVNPTAMALNVLDGSNYYHIGSMNVGLPTTIDFDDVVYLGGSPGDGDGPIDAMEVTDVSGEVADFLARARRAANDLLKAHKASDKADRLAKRKGRRPNRFPPAKRAEKKVLAEAKDFVEFLERPVAP